MIGTMMTNEQALIKMLGYLLRTERFNYGDLVLIPQLGYEIDITQFLKLWELIEDEV